MKKSELEKLYNRFNYFIEAFTSVGVITEKDGDEEFKYYQVSFNEYEMISFKDLCKICDVLGDLLKLNGSDIKKLSNTIPNAIENLDDETYLYEIK